MENTSTQDLTEENNLGAAEVNYDTAIINQFIVLGGEVKQDGNMFGAIIGQMPAAYCGAFEKTRLLAIHECMKNFRLEEVKVPKVANGIVTTIRYI